MTRWLGNASKALSIAAILGLMWLAAIAHTPHVECGSTNLGPLVAVTCVTLRSPS